MPTPLFSTRTLLIDLIVPDHVSWSFDGVAFAPIDNKPDTQFSFALGLALVQPPTNLKAAVHAAVRRLHLISNMPLAICISGADSEIIARAAKETNVPFELFFLNIWGTNKQAHATAIRLATELSCKLNVVDLSKEHALTSVIPATYCLLQCRKPTYLILPYLFQNIPTDFYIVGGEGDPEKTGPDYKHKENRLPISITEVYYRQWALLNNRAVEMYFFASTRELIRSYFNHPLLQKTANSIQTRKVRDAEWPELLFKTKTTNWEDDPAENAFIRAQLPANGWQAAPKSTLAETR